MKAYLVFFAAVMVSTLALADLHDSCVLTDKTSCVLNTGSETWKQFVVWLPNYEFCGVRFVSDTYPDYTQLSDFMDGLYVTAGPRWDLTEEQTGEVAGNLNYPVGNTQYFATYFNVYTRSGQTLSDYITEKLGTTYQPNPTLSLVAVPCN